MVGILPALAVIEEFQKKKNEYISETNATKKLALKQKIDDLLAKIFEASSEILVNKAMIRFFAPNEDFAKDIQHLLLRFGILSKRERRKIKIYGEIDLALFAQEIGKYFISAKKDDMQKLDVRHQRLFDLKSPAEGNTGIWDIIPYKIQPILQNAIENRDETAEQLAKKAGVSLTNFSKRRGKKNFRRTT